MTKKEEEQERREELKTYEKIERNRENKCFWLKKELNPQLNIYLQY